jgi:hypothetical protein
MDCLLPKEAETKPWEKLCVDLIGRYIPSERKDVKTEHADVSQRVTQQLVGLKSTNMMTTVNPSCNIIEQVFSRYPWPTQVTFDQGNKFISQDFQQIIKTFMVSN